ncbi:MAG: transposase domain-containing protein [Actinomycetota bacterium]|nr:transposase domain-containing protein [Actinomycetota bacterium]
MLSGLIDRDIVDDVINECRKREKRLRLLPAHVVVYYVLASSQLLGLAFMRWMCTIAPPATRIEGKLVAAVASTLQRYWTAIWTVTRSPGADLLAVRRTAIRGMSADAHQTDHRLLDGPAVLRVLARTSSDIDGSR